MEQTKKLYRSCDNRIIAGIAGGLGEYLEVDPLVVRLIFLLLIFSGIDFAAYIVAWVLIPNDPKCANKSGSEEIKEKAESFANEFRDMGNKDDSDLRIIFGAIILAFGLLLLFQNLVGELVWKIFWPAILILFGFYLITKSSESRR